MISQDVTIRSATLLHKRLKISHWITISKYLLNFFYYTRKSISQFTTWNQIKFLPLSFSPRIIFALVSCVLFCKHAAFNWCNFPYNFPLLLSSTHWFAHPRDTSDNNPVDMIHRKILSYIANCAKSTNFQGEFLHNRKRRKFQEGLSEMIASGWFPSITSNRFSVKPLKGFQLIAFNKLINFELCKVIVVIKTVLLLVELEFGRGNYFFLRC